MTTRTRRQHRHQDPSTGPDQDRDAARTTANVLEVHGLHKTYGAIIALAGIDLTVQRGRIVGLLGPNGAGKTTLVSIICGLRRPDRGSVTVNGTDALAHPQRARAHIGLAPQDMGIYPSVTVRNNLQLFAELTGLSGSALNSQIEQIAAALRLDELLDRKSGTLSGGQKRRLHTAIALLDDPPLVLLDEPTTGADVETRAALLDVVTDLARRGSSVLYSTHYLQEIETLDAAVVIIEQGKIIASGAVQDLVAAHADNVIAITFDGTAPPKVDGHESTVEGSVMRVAAHDPGQAIPRILAALGTHTSRITAIEIIRPSLETAYLTLTGRRYTERDQINVAAP